MNNSDDRILQDYRKLLVVLESQRRALAVAGSASDVLNSYSTVLKFLRGLSHSKVVELHGRKSSTLGKQPIQQLSELQLAMLSLDEIEKIAQDEKTSRKTLEQIAISRFHVPRGSMRSFQNMKLLREKILVGVRNEKTHQTIDQVAKKARL